MHQTPLNGKLPRGLKAYLARKTNLSWASIHEISKGRWSNPAIYKLIVETAVEWKKREEEENRQLEEINELAKQL